MGQGHWLSTRVDTFPTAPYRAFWYSAAAMIAVGSTCLLFGLTFVIEDPGVVWAIEIALTLLGLAMIARGVVIARRRKAQRDARRAAVPPRRFGGPEVLPDLPPVPPPFPGGSRQRS